MFVYSAYNLLIHSELFLPELTTLEDFNLHKKPDVIISLRKINASEQEAVNGGDCFLGDSFLGNSEVGRFLVRDGHQIILDPVPGIDAAAMRSIILGPSLSVLLRQRRLLLLHGSCVAVNGSAIAFIGDSGWGKSTLAEAFRTQGHSLFTDDLTAVDMESTKPCVIPGFPQVRLWSDTAFAFGHNFSKLQTVHAMTDKRVHRFTKGFSQTPLELKRIYVLAKGKHHAILPLTPKESFVSLIQFSHAIKELKNPYFTKLHFEQCMELFKQISICKLQREFSFEALPSLVNLIKEDLSEKK